MITGVSPPAAASTATPWLRYCRGNNFRFKKGKGSPYSITERTVPALIPVLGSQRAGDVSRKPGGRLPLTFRQACSYPRNP